MDDAPRKEYLPSAVLAGVYARFDGQERAGALTCSGQEAGMTGLRCALA